MSSQVVSYLIGEATFNDIVSFEVYPSSIIGNNFNRVKLKGLIDAETAQLYGYDVYALHDQVRATIPNGTMPAEANRYQYLLIELQDGTRYVIGKPWIKLDTLKVHKNQHLTIVCQIDDVSQRTKIVELLHANDIPVIAHYFN